MAEASKTVKRRCSGPDLVDKFIRQVLQDTVECSYCGVMGYERSYYQKDSLLFCGELCAHFFQSCDLRNVKPLPTIDFKSLLEKDTEENRALLSLGRRKVTRIGLKKVPIYTYNWPRKDKINAAPVQCFKHAPGALFWSRYIVDGIKVEVENIGDGAAKSCWVATLEKLRGYFGYLRYVAWPSNKSGFWVNMCSPLVHPVGWSAAHGRPLTPPQLIAGTRSSTQWLHSLSQALYSTSTLPWTFDEKLSDSLESRFRPGQLVEVVDKNRLSVVKLAEIYLISARRLNISYYDNDCQDSGFICNEDSPLLHPVGWAESVGHWILAPPDYSTQWRTKTEKYALSSTSEQFKEPPLSNVELEVGMKLEVIDPLNLSTICVATIKKVLRNSYMMVCIDKYDLDQTNSDWFCCHVTSTSIFPVGFCETNKITIVKPKGFKGSNFKWSDYLKQTNSLPAQIPLKDVPQHGFTVGMQLEVVDLMGPYQVCVGTISRVVGRLLRVHFDEWPTIYDQWMDCESADIYPVGWCEAVKHKLTGPRGVLVAASGEIANVTPAKLKKVEEKNVNRKIDINVAGDIIPCLKKIEAPKCTEDLSNPPILELQNCFPEPQEKVTDHFDPPALSPPIDVSSFVPEMAADQASWETPSTSSQQQSSFKEFSKKSYSKSKRQRDSKEDFWYEEEHPKILSTKTRSGKLMRYASGTLFRKDSAYNRILKRASKHQSTVQSTKATQKKKKPRLETAQVAAPTRVTPHSHEKPHMLFTPLQFQASTDRVIPRLVDQSPNIAMEDLKPSMWNVRDVAQFLRVNDMEQYSDSFSQRKIDGPTLLNLTLSSIIHLTDKKVGPAMHIAHLIKLLKLKLK